MKKILTLTVLALSFLTQATFAADNPNASIAYRKAVMEGIGGHTAAIASILKGDIADKSQLNNHVNALALAVKTSESAIKTNTDSKGSAKTDAKPEIWTKWDDFAKKDMAMVTAVQALADKANKGEITIADFAPVGAACKACHQDYKK